MPVLPVESEIEGSRALGVPTEHPTTCCCQTAFALKSLPVSTAEHEALESSVAQSIVSKAEEPDKPMDATAAWCSILKSMKEYDERTIDVWKTEMDNALIFAGLLSTVVTAFTIESYQLLKPDTNGSGDTMSTISNQLASFTLLTHLHDLTRMARETIGIISYYRDIPTHLKDSETLGSTTADAVVSICESLEILADSQNGCLPIDNQCPSRELAEHLLDICVGHPMLSQCVPHLRNSRLPKKPPNTRMNTTNTVYEKEHDSSSNEIEVAVLTHTGELRSDEAR